MAAAIVGDDTALDHLAINFVGSPQGEQRPDSFEFLWSGKMSA